MTGMEKEIGRVLQEYPLEKNLMGCSKSYGRRGEKEKVKPILCVKPGIFSDCTWRKMERKNLRIIFIT